MALTSKQEAFCQAIVSGLNQSDAYRKAYNTENWSPEAIWVEASRLADNPTVSLRVQEMNDLAAAGVIAEKHQILEEATLNVRRGRELDQIAASNGALGLIADVQGLKVHKVEHSGVVGHIIRPGDSLEELEARMERIKALEAGVIEGQGTVVDDEAPSS